MIIGCAVKWFKRCKDKKLKIAKLKTQMVKKKYKLKKIDPKRVIAVEKL